MFRFSMLLVVATTAMIASLSTFSERVSATADEIETNSARQATALEGKATYPDGFINEGPLPAGFPPPGEVGKVVEKTYPLCRTYSAEGNAAFMRCFAYLSKQQHEMTAPVIMDYQRRDPAADQKPADAVLGNVARMHFVLADISLDEPKQEDAVLVADMAKMRVMSIAVQGEMSPRALEDARQLLVAEVASRTNISVAGPIRVLGYNSPMVPSKKRFWEVQLPIEEAPGPKP